MGDKLLLIWEKIGEQGDVFELDASTPEAEWARQSAGAYINGDDLPDDHAIFKLNDWLEGREPLSPSAPLAGPFSEAVVCGFFL